MPLSKSVAGFAPAPPIPAMNPAGGVPAGIAALLAAAAPAPGPAVFPPAALPFPNTTAVTLTMAQIGYLARWYNNPFGIVAGDALGAQQQKLRLFLSGLV